MAGRIRSIKPEVLDDEVAARLSDAAWRLRISLWVLADDHGNVRLGDRYVAANVWQDTARKVAKPIIELATAGFIVIYSVAGQRYAHIAAWTSEQRIDNAGKARVPPPSADDGSVPMITDSCGRIRVNPPQVSETRGDSPRVAAGAEGNPLGPPLDLRSPIPITDHRTGITEKAPPLPGLDPKPIATPAPPPTPPPPATATPVKAPAEAPSAPGSGVAPKREPGQATRDYAQQFAFGIQAGAGPGTKSVAPQVRGDQDRAMRDVLVNYAKDPAGNVLRGEVLRAWIYEQARLYRIARPHGDFEQGWSHVKFLEWFRKGCTAEPGRASVAPVQRNQTGVRHWTVGGGDNGPGKTGVGT